MTVGGTPTIRMMLQNGYKINLWAYGPLLDVETVP
jgi:hypothetical protein